jgi:hypothetical protein
VALDDPCSVATNQKYDENGDGKEHPRGVLLVGHTCAGFQPSNINHELCHCTDDVTRVLASNQQPWDPKAFSSAK